MEILRLSDVRLYDKISACFGEGGGVYRLHCLATDSDHAVAPLPRALSVDEEGVLYIGKAARFLDRVITLKKAMSPNHHSGGHIAGRRYKGDTYTSFRQRFPFARLCLTFFPAESPEALEKTKLNEYCRRFGEPPPLNRME